MYIHYFFYPLARITPFNRVFSQSRDRTCVSYLLYWQAGPLPLVPPRKPNNNSQWPNIQ